MTPQLKRIINVATGEQVRMANLKVGDLFQVYQPDDDGSELDMGRWIADEDGHTQTTEKNLGEEHIGMGAVIAHKETA